MSASEQSGPKMYVGRTPKQERAWIELPLPIDVSVAILNGIADVWPEAVAVADHGRPGSWLCVQRQPTKQATDGCAK